ncbi:MAG TPA: thioesterase domain-containing protein, partial [Acidimicrobiales bacterium]
DVTDVVGLRDVVLVSPLVVRDDATVTVKVTVTRPDSRGRRTVRLESDGGDGQGWTLHSEAEVASAVGVAPARVDLAAVAARCNLDGVDPLVSPRRHALLGSRWDCVVEARRGDGETFGRLQLRNGAAQDIDAWRAHPGLVDVATALGVLLGRYDDPDVLYVPTSYESITSYAALPASVAVHATRSAASSDDMLLVDLMVTDDDGHVLLDVRGLGLRPIRDPGALASAAPTGQAVGRPVPPLLALADELGIREQEGPDLVERLVASDADYLIASSVDLDELMAPTEPALAQSEATASPSNSTDATTVEAAITAMWRDLLGLPDISPDDDFFELGGHSLIAIRLMARIHRELGVRFQLATLFEAPTIAQLAELVRAERPDIDAVLAAASGAEAAETSEQPTEQALVAPAVVAPVPATSTLDSCLIPIRASGEKAPFFVVHGAGGNVMFLSTLARVMPEDRPVYGLQAKGVNKGERIDPSLEAMAARYVAALRAFTPGPYLLGGYSGGGIVALEMAHQLEELGEEVAYCVLFDTIVQHNVDPPPFQRRKNLLINTLRHGVAVWPFVKQRIHAKLRGEHIELFRDVRLDGMGFDDLEQLGIVDLFDEFTARAERYKMRPHYNVDALLIKAADVWPMQPYDYLLSKYVRRLDIRTTPFGHRAMFTPEYAPQLAAIVAPALDAHEPRR